MQTVNLKEFHLSSALPGAGSPLLNSIIKQNPKFSATISDPLYSFVHILIRDINSPVGVVAQIT
jgi:hypothetical protein